MSVGLHTRRKLVLHFALVLLAGLLLTAGGCRSTAHEIPVYRQGPVVVSLRSFAKGGHGPALRYDHPATISSEQIGRILAAVTIEEFSFFKWREEGTAFASEDAALLAPNLADALRRAAPEQWVYFSARNVPKAFTFGAVRFTDGIAFVKAGKLNLVFDNVGYVENVDTQPSRSDPRDAATSQSQRLKAKGPDVLGAAPPLVSGDHWLGRERTNWLVFDLSAAAAAVAGAPPTPVPQVAAPAAPAATPVSASAPASTDPEERLRKLKDLRDKGLITSDEYEKKRQEILKGL
jgi:hypothetical protein